MVQQRTYVSVYSPAGRGWCNNLAPSRHNALERLSTRAARIILKERSLSHDHLLRQLSWMSLNARSNMYIVTFEFKCVHNNAPDLFKEYFVKTSHNYSTRRNGLEIFVPKVSTELQRKAFTFSQLKFVRIYNRAWKKPNLFNF